MRYENITRIRDGVYRGHSAVGTWKIEHDRMKPDLWRGWHEGGVRGGLKSIAGPTLGGISATLTRVSEAYQAGWAVAQAGHPVRKYASRYDDDTEWAAFLRGWQEYQP